MSVIRVNKSDVENFTLVTSPNRIYASSSVDGVTGDIKVFPRRSNVEKDTDSSFTFNESNAAAAVDSNFDSEFEQLSKSISSGRSISASVYGDVDKYLSLVNGTQSKKIETLEIERFVPTTKFSKYTVRKNNVKDMLMPYYRSGYPHANWSYTNYNTLNFFTAVSGTTKVQMVPTSSVLLYPNLSDQDVIMPSGYASGSYCLSGAFSFDFHINPRYNYDGTDGSEFKTGTIFHLSSSYALSMTTGSKKDINGNPVGFRLQLQLSHSADYAPSKVLPGSYPNDLVFQSDDNALTYNNWHHVVVRWGTNLVNDGTGSFVVDGIRKGDFVIPSGTVLPQKFSTGNPDVLCIGNFYEGQNSLPSVQSLFFNTENSLRDGVEQMTTLSSVGSEGPSDSAYSFSHPLKAEVHDLSIKRYYVTDKEISVSGSLGPGINATDKNKFAFYVPPFFVEDTPIRLQIDGRGGILQTPFFEMDGTTDDPFNVAMAFGVNGHYINLENFTKDFSTGRFPRLLQLSASAIGYTTAAQEANDFIYQQKAAAKRNLTILPCDDGKFGPNYSVLAQEDYQNRFSDSLGNPNYSYINLDNLILESSLLNGGVQPEAPEDFVKTVYGANPEQPGLPPGSSYLNYISSVSSSISNNSFDKGIQRGAPLTIYQRTLDPSSNQVTFFNISNLYYGKRILPGSFEINDASLSGSFGSIKITLRDDGMGSLYRADAEGIHSTQSCVGNIFYDEGIVVIKSPHLYFFGKNQFEISFKGVQNIHTQKYEILAGSGLLNSSSNSTYSTSLKASGDVQDTQPFVYISGMYFHDENMNVVAKAKFAQPIIKREEDKVLFRVVLDF